MVLLGSGMAGDVRMMVNKKTVLFFKMLTDTHLTVYIKKFPTIIKFGTLLIRDLYQKVL